MKGKKTAALLLALFCIQGGVSADFQDMGEHWAGSALESAVENKLLNGENGKLYPDEAMTRAQLAAVLVRGFGAKRTADLSQYEDLDPQAWYYESMEQAAAMGALYGSENRMRPQDSVTREEAFTVLARIFGLEKGQEMVLEAFADREEISDWAKEACTAMISAGYAGGSGGYLNPRRNITRAEFAVLMDRLVKNYIDIPGEYTQLPQGNVLIRVPGVTIKGVVTEDDIFVGDGVEDGSISFLQVDFQGRTVIRAGGEQVTAEGSFANFRVVMPYIKVFAQNARIAKGYICKDSVIDWGIVNP